MVLNVIPINITTPKTVTIALYEYEDLTKAEYKLAYLQGAGV